MIDIDKLHCGDIGRKVVYQCGPITEEGELTSWNHRFVFVQFRGPNGEACDPTMVSFAVQCEQCQDSGSVLIDFEHRQWVPCGCSAGQMSATHEYLNTEAGR